MSSINVGLQVIPRVRMIVSIYVVDKVIEHMDKSGVKYEVGPLETTMEGELNTPARYCKKGSRNLR